MRNAATFATGSLLASVASAQVVQWDIVRGVNAAPRLNRRANDGSVSEVITNEKTRGGYFASCTVGTPPQKLTLQLDTGSSDIWVPASTSQVCEETSQEGSGCTFGSYNSAKSSTYEEINTDFNIAYVDGSSATGDYIAETFGIGDVSLENTTMGYALDTDIPYGLVGVGYALNEASVAHDDYIYDNLPVVMVNEGHIATNAYSLWLNDLDASTGNILFGGIDTEKYVGDLARIDVKKDPQTGVFSSFIVELTSLKASSSSGNDSLTSLNFPIDVVLDSGTTFSYLPQDLAEQVWKEVGVVYVDVGGQGAPLLPCDLQNNNGYFEFGFGGNGGPAIRVGMDELVVDLSSGDPPLFDSGTYKGRAACQFGIQNFSSDPFLLGDTFLRSAYVVYDLQNNEIALAPTDFNSTKSNIVAFSSMGAEIPKSTPAPNQDSLPVGTSTQPKYNAMEGFMDNTSTGSGSGSGSGSGNGTGNGDDNGNAASLPSAIDFTQWTIMGASMAFMMLGGGMFVLF